MALHFQRGRDLSARDGEFSWDQGEAFDRLERRERRVDGVDRFLE